MSPDSIFRSYRKVRLRHMRVFLAIALSDTYTMPKLSLANKYAPLSRLGAWRPQLDVVPPSQVIRFCLPLKADMYGLLDSEHPRPIGSSFMVRWFVDHLGKIELNWHHLCLCRGEVYFHNDPALDYTASSSFMFMTGLNHGCSDTMRIDHGAWNGLAARLWLARSRVTMSLLVASIRPRRTSAGCPFVARTIQAPPLLLFLHSECSKPLEWMGQPPPYVGQRVSAKGLPIIISPTT